MRGPGEHATVTPSGRAAARTGVFARPRSVFHDRNESPGGGERTRAASSRRSRWAASRASSADCVVHRNVEAHAVAPLKPGDGIVFDAADWRSPEEPEEGGRIYRSFARAAGIELRFAQWCGAVSTASGWATWCGARTIRISIAPRGRSSNRRRRSRGSRVDVRVIAQEGDAAGGRVVLVKRPESARDREIGMRRWSAAQNRALSIESLRDQFGRLGNTPYELG